MAFADKSITFNVSAAPSWFTSLTAGVWGTVAGGSGQKIGDAGVIQSPTATSGLSGENPQSIADAWTSGGVDQSNGELIVAANGGHADYPGNEAYGLALRVATPAWRRLSNSTPNANFGGTVTESATYADGRPRAMHSTFATFGDGRMWFPLMNSVTSGGGGSVNQVVSYDRAGLGAATTPLAWTGSNLGPWTLHGAIASLALGAGGPIFGRGVHDRTNGYVYGFSGYGYNNSVCQYWRTKTRAPNLGTVEAAVTLNGGNPYANFQTWAVECPDLGIIVLGDQVNNRIMVLTLSQVPNPSAMAAITNVTGSGAHFGSGAGAVYWPGAKAIYVGNPSAIGNSIRKLVIPTTGSAYNPAGQWTWSTVSVSGATPSFARPTAPNWINGKWGLIEDMGNGQGCLVALTSINHAVMVMKIPEAGL